jgi:hypothetical protein
VLFDAVPLLGVLAPCDKLPLGVVMWPELIEGPDEVDEPGVCEALCVVVPFEYGALAPPKMVSVCSA